MGLLQNRVAIVTGAGGLHGIGRAIALAMAQEGCRVAVAGGSATEQVADEIRADGGEAVAIQCDVSVPSDIERMVQRTEAELGPIDILCNNAGILRLGRLHEVTLEDWNRTLEVNLTGLFLCTQSVAARMTARGAGGRIINISSLCGHQGCPRQLSYAASKAGVEGFTKSIAEDLGAHGITANCIAPGPVYTNMTGKAAPPDQEPARWSGAAIPDFGLPPDVAGAAVFLASDLASWVTGAVLIVDGGRLVQ